MKSWVGKYNNRYELDQTQKQNYSSQIKGKTGSGTSKLCNFCGYAWPHLFFFGGGGGANKIPCIPRRYIETVDVKTILRDAAKVQLKV